jgi:hypothetical protein
MVQGCQTERQHDSATVRGCEGLEQLQWCKPRKDVARGWWHCRSERVSVWCEAVQWRETVRRREGVIQRNGRGLDMARHRDSAGVQVCDLQTV